MNPAHSLGLVCPRSLIFVQHFRLRWAPQLLTDSLWSQVKYRIYPEEKLGCVDSEGELTLFIQFRSWKLHYWLPYLGEIPKLVLKGLTICWLDP